MVDETKRQQQWQGSRAAPTRPRPSGQRNLTRHGGNGLVCLVVGVHGPKVVFHALVALAQAKESVAVAVAVAVAEGKEREWGA